MKRIAAFVRDIWYGRIPLARVFWEYAIGYGTVLNLLATLAAFSAFSRHWPEALGLAIFFLPAPYNLLMIVGVWRSAAIYQGPAIWPTLARALIIAWAAAATFI
jgi:hypothetical protein